MQDQELWRSGEGEKEDEGGKERGGRIARARNDRETLREAGNGNDEMELGYPSLPRGRNIPGGGILIAGRGTCDARDFARTIFARHFSGRFHVPVSNREPPSPCALFIFFPFFFFFFLFFFPLFFFLLETSAVSASRRRGRRGRLLNRAARFSLSRETRNYFRPRYELRAR